MQRPRQTIANAVDVSGRGVHSGEICNLRLRPAALGTGYTFIRTDIPGQPQIPATLSSVVKEELSRRTTLAAGAAKVFTVEHLLSAARAVGVDDLLIEMNQPEPPFLDGSAAPFVDLFRRAEIIPHANAAALVSPLVISDYLVLQDGDAEIVATPADHLRITYFYASDQPRLRTQSISLALFDAETYTREIAPARTFCFFEEIEQIRRAGLARGGSLASVVVIGRKAILNESLRFPDEPVRHKVLDLIGDLALLGRPILGHILAWRSGHRTNARFAEVLAAHAANSTLT